MTFLGPTQPKVLTSKTRSCTKCDKHPLLLVSCPILFNKCRQNNTANPHEMGLHLVQPTVYIYFNCAVIEQVRSKMSFLCDTKPASRRLLRATD
jgi:hypothetical protein